MTSSEYARLASVLLHSPGDELRGIRNPKAVQQLAPIDVPAIRREFARIRCAYRRLGVRVHEIGGGLPATPNLMFARDLLFMTPRGAVVAKMAGRVRAGEEKNAALALVRIGIPILRMISGRGTFEGADALWLDRSTVLCGVGGRTNAEGLRQLRGTLAAQGVSTIAVAVPRGIQHLLGILQLVDRKLALARADIAPRGLLRLLKKRGIEVVAIRECPEVSERQGMNIVTVAPRKVLMPDDCPGMRRRLQAEGIAVAAVLDIRQLRRGAGGLACATGILSRLP